MYGSPNLDAPQIASIQNGPYCRGQLAVLGRLIAELGGHFVRFVQGSIFPRCVDKGSSVLIEIHALCDWDWKFCRSNWENVILIVAQIYHCSIVPWMKNRLVTYFLPAGRQWWQPASCVRALVQHGCNAAGWLHFRVSYVKGDQGVPPLGSLKLRFRKRS